MHLNRPLPPQQAGSIRKLLKGGIKIGLLWLFRSHATARLNCQLQTVPDLEGG